MNAGIPNSEARSFQYNYEGGTMNGLRRFYRQTILG